MARQTNAEQSMEELRQRFNRLHEQKITAAADLKNAEETLSALKEQARTNWGTDDIQQLERKLEEMTAENERKRAEYQRHLEKIEADLAAVERDAQEPKGQA